VRALFVVLLFAQYAHAEAGLSYLGLCSPSWNCSESLRAFNGRDRIVTGWLENTFAKDCRCGERILKSERAKTIRVNIVNSPCLRNRRCGKYEVFSGETITSANRKVARRDRKLLRKYRAVLMRFRNRLSQAKGEVACYVAPCLECDLGASARRVLLNIVRRRLPGCVPVDSVIGGRCLAGTVCERHGPNPRLAAPCIADLDGINGNAVNLEQFGRRVSTCDVRYYWEPAYNCIRSNSFVDPRSRDCRYSKETYRRAKRKLCSLSLDQSSGTC
jgi:hypothetical protein